MTKPVYWAGPVEDRCQVSQRALNGVMYDARLPNGSWANISHDTFVNLGCKLGVGRGQKYRKQDDDRWLLVAGSAAHEKPAAVLSDADKRQIADEAEARKNG